MQNNISNNIGFNSNWNKTNVNNLNFNHKTNNASAYYAKKGEPMYIKEMDADEDGIVSFEEFKDYCDEKGISINERIRMTQLASSYRTMQAQQKASKKIKEESKDKTETDNKTEAESEAVYARRGDGKYDEVMDTNNDDKISYKEYIEYCREHSKLKEEKADTKVEETDNGEFKTTSLGKAINSYSQSETEAPEGKIEDLG